MINAIIDLKTLLTTPYVDPDNRFDFSPDGKRVAFSWNPTGQWEIYEVGLDDASSPKQLTHGAGGKFSPAYAPGGERLAYAVDLDGGENFRLFIHDFRSGEQTDLTPEGAGALQPHFAWSPDGNHIAILSNRSGIFKTYILPVGGGQERLVLDTVYPAYKVHWSTDGNWLLVVAQTIGSDFGVFVVSTQGHVAEQISDENGPLSATGACWSPDGRQIAFASDARGEFDIAVYTLQSANVKWLTHGSGEKGSPAWSRDGKRLVYIHAEDAVNHLVVLDLETNTSRGYAVDQGLHSLPEFTPQGEALVCVFDNPRLPDDLWRISLEDGSTHQLTQSLPSELQQARFSMPEVIRYPGMDGVPVPALLYKPPDTKSPPPGVVLVHGGPNWRFDVMWYPLVQHMVSRGWVVLLPNYRGSTGYGRDWQYASRYDQGGVDMRDVAAGAHFLIQSGLADPQRIAVSGRSHGGYLTMCALTAYPQLWAAGSAVVPFLNWFTSHANSRDDLQHWDRENFGDPVKDHDLWYERSPYFFLDQIEAPVQLICGANDPRCPASESIAARDALLALGKAVDFHLYPDEGHAFLKTDNVLDSEARRIDFLASVLEG